MCTDIEKFVKNCQLCQAAKANNKQYMKILATEAETVLWRTVCVDIASFDKQKILSIIDSVTRWLELITLEDKTSDNVAKKFDTVWLCWYSRPAKCIYDNDTEFIDKEFQEILDAYSIKAVITTVKNLQANSTLERTYQVIENILYIIQIKDWEISLYTAAFTI